MNSLEFIEKMVGHLIWPGFAAVILFMLRNHLIEIVHLMKTLKIPGLEIAFQELRSEAAAAQLPPPDPQVQNNEENRTFLELADSSPTAAILHSWQNVEREIGDLLDKYNVAHPQDGALPSMAPVRALYRMEIIDPNTLGVLHQLRRVRNEVVHAPGRAVTLGGALEFRQLSQAVISKLRELGSRPPAGQA